MRQLVSSDVCEKVKRYSMSRCLVSVAELCPPSDALQAERDVSGILVE